MATKTNEMTAQLADKKKPQEQATATVAEETDDLVMYTPTLNENYITVTPEQESAVKQRWAINDDEKATTYIERTTPKPKALDEKKVKRAKLFAGISDAAMALADGITLSQGGLIAPRESAYGTASKAIEVQKAKAAKEIAAYNKLYQEALQSDAKTAREARKGLAGDLQKLYDDADKANRQIYADNIKAANDASKTNAGAVNKVIAEQGRRIWQANENEKNRNNATRNAVIRAAASGKDKDDNISTITLANGVTYAFPTAKVRQRQGELDAIIQLAIQNETNTRLKGKWQSWDRAHKLDMDDIANIAYNSSYFTTPEGKAKLEQLVYSLNNPDKAIVPTIATGLADTPPHLRPQPQQPTTLKPIEE